MTALHVLIVDDDPALLQALPETLRLRMDGVTVDTADSAVRRWSDQRPGLRRDRHRYQDAGMDGLTLLAEIAGRRPDTPRS